MCDNQMFPWALGSFARALLYFSQAKDLKNRQALSAISTYYSLFHLGMFLIYSCPKHLKANLRQKIEDFVQKNNGADPSPQIRHVDVRGFVEDAARGGLSGEVSINLAEGNRLRNFINYGPRVSSTESSGIYVNSCEAQPEDCVALQGKLEMTFRHAIAWACVEGVDNGRWIPAILLKCGTFFQGSARFYGNWCGLAEASAAETLRESLHSESLRLVFGNGTPADLPPDTPVQEDFSSSEGEVDKI